MRWIVLTGLMACSDKDSAPTTAVDTDTDTDADSDADSDSDSDSDTDTDTGAAAALASNRALWKASAISDYRYVLAYQCFCPKKFTGPADIAVSGGVVSSSTYVSDGSPTHVSFDARTVEELFDLVQDGLTADAMTVTYDPTYGYPASGYIDYIADADDDELGFTATALVAD